MELETRSSLVSDMTRRDAFKRAAVGAVGLSSAGLLLQACGDDEPAGSGSGSNSLVELSAFPGANFLAAMTYIGQDQGYYKQEGIDFKIEYPGNTVRAIQTLVGGSVGVGWSDVFGILVAVGGGFQLKSLFQTYVGNGFGEYVLLDSPIKTFDVEQIKGTTIGITAPDGGEVPSLRGVLAKLGLEEGSDYKLATVGDGPPEIVDALESGRVDVMAMSSNDAALAQGAGAPTRQITPRYVLDFPGHSYSTTPELVESNPKLLKGFLRARAKSMVFLRANPTAAAEIAIKAAPESAEGFDKAGVAKILKNFWVTQNQQYFDEGSPDFHLIGRQSAEQWNSYQDFLIEGGVEAEGESVSEPVDVESVIDNSMIEAANDFDYAAIEQSAKNYKA